MKATRYNHLDLLRFILSFGVIAAHVIGTNPFAKYGITWLTQCYEVLINLPVPYFFITSGYLMGIKLNWSVPMRENAGYVFRAVLKYLKLYLIASVAYLPLAIYDYVRNSVSPVRAILYYVRDLLFMGEHYMSWQLWYLLATILALVIIGLLMRINTRPRVILSISILLYILGVAINWLVVPHEDCGAFLKLLNRLLNMTIRSGRIFYGSIYIYFGMLFAHNKTGKKLAPALFLLFAVVFALTRNEYARMLLIPCFCIPFFAMVDSLHLKASAVYPWLRTLSRVNYFSHTYVFVICSMLMFGTLRMGVGMWSLTSILCVILGIAWHYITLKRRNRQNVK